MGIFDKLKSVAENVSKAAETALNANKEEVVDKDICCRGIISGADLPTEKGLTLWFGIDKDNQDIIVCKKKSGAFGSKNLLVKKFSCNDVVEFKHDKHETNNIPSGIQHSYYNELLLASGDSLFIYGITSSQPVKDTTSMIDQEKEEWDFLQTLILTFADRMKGEKAKEWVSEILDREGAGLPFDKNSQIDLPVLSDVLFNVYQRKCQEWSKRKIAYTKSLYNQEG